MSYVIIFWDGAKIQVSNATGEKLKILINEGNIKNFIIGNNLYAVSDVKRILTKDDAYDEFPKEWDKLQTMQDEVSANIKSLKLELPKLT